MKDCLVQAVLESFWYPMKRRPVHADLAIFVLVGC